MSFDSLPPIDEIQINHYFNLARNVCYCGDFMKACLGTVLIHKDKVMSISREQVEKVWRGEWKHYLPPLGAGNIQCRCTKCGITPDVETPFCAWCGASMTDEAVQMVMERLEALKNES